jgi:hypothetical protein
MLRIKKPFVSYGTNKLITNVEKGRWQYYVSMISIFVVITIINIALCQYVFFQQQEKELAFTEGNEISIKNFILSDLKIIFDKSSSLNQLNILKNYSQINLKKQNIIVVGNILYIIRGQGQMIFDLQPLLSLVNSILGKNFYYQISLNDQLLVTNIEDFNFLSVNRYQINEDNFLTRIAEISGACSRAG